jgi:cell division protein FtsL
VLRVGERQPEGQAQRRDDARLERQEPTHLRHQDTSVTRIINHMMHVIIVIIIIIIIIIIPAYQ